MKLTDDDILDKLESYDPEERYVGLLWIASYKPDGFLGDVLRLLRDPEPVIRAKAAWTLDQLNQVAAMPGLISALNDTVYNVRSAAAWALVHLGEVVVEEVIEVLRFGLKDAREMAYQILLRIHSDEARAAIKRYWDQDNT